MSVLKDILENGGFVQKKAAEGNDDGRKVYMHLTEKGKAVGQQIAEKIDRILTEAGEGISEANRTIMYESLFSINSNLQKHCSAHEK